MNKSISSVGYQVRALGEYGAVELIDKQPRRGSVEHFYEATLVDEVPWARLALGLPPSPPHAPPQERPPPHTEGCRQRDLALLRGGGQLP